MNRVLAGRILGCAVLLLIAAAIAIVPALNRPTVKGDVLQFSLPDLEGNIIDQDHPDFRDKVLMVNLWGTWCPPCRAELPHLIRLKKMYGERGFEIIAIEFPALSQNSEEERRQALANFVNEVGINYTVLMGGHASDLTADLPNLTNASDFPTNIFIGRSGKVHSIRTGFYEGDIPEYEALIEKLLDAPQPESVRLSESNLAAFFIR